MSALILSLARRSLIGVVQDDVRDGGIREWMENGSFAIQENALTGNVEFLNVNRAEFSAYQAYDYQRFVLSSRESLGSSSSDISSGGAQGWPLIKAYYAGFFGGHALLRALGRGVIRVEPPQAKRLTALGKIFCGDDFIFTTGTYEINLRQNIGGIHDLTLQKAPDGGGAHEVFWRVFKRVLLEIAQDVIRDADPDSTLVVGRIGDIMSLCSSRGMNSGTWLSAVRNEINYQHKYGVWFPVSASKAEDKLVKKFSYSDTSALRLDSNADRDPIISFFAGSVFLASASHELCEQLQTISGKSSKRFSGIWRRLCSMSEILHHTKKGRK